MAALGARQAFAGDFAVQAGRHCARCEYRLGLGCVRVRAARQRCEKGKALHPDWSEALRRVAKANERRYKGFSDWRLPNVKELFSIVDPARQMPAIAKESFPASEPDWFWSSTTRVAYNGGVHTVDFAVGHARYDNKPEAHFMRLVRGGL